MNTYHIKIDGKYYAGYSEAAQTTVPTGGWYDNGGTVSGLILAFEPEYAKLIEGNINLKSELSRIYNLIRYGDLEFTKLEILKVG